MRWLSVFALIAASAAEIPEAQKDVSRLQKSHHGYSQKVQEALDELRVVGNQEVSRTRSRSRTIFEFVRHIGRQKNFVPSVSVDTDTFADPLRKLQDASENEADEDAIFLLAEMSFHGNFSFPRDYHAALKYYTRLAESTGNMTAQENVALLYSTGLQGIEADQGLALTYHTFAAAQGSLRSQMALGFRYLNGIGVAPNCSDACRHYSAAAKAAIEWAQSGPPGGMYWSPRAYRFSQEFGGLYGSAPILKSVVTTDSRELDDVIDYYTYLAEKSDIQACFSLAKLYNEGSRAIETDFVKSLYWFRQVAKSYWTRDGRTVKGMKPLRYHAKSAAYIGTAYLRGEGTDQDFEKAKMWFMRGVALGDPTAQNGFALMHLQGLGPVKRDINKAEELFRAASDNEHHGAHIHLGKILAARGDIVTATRLFQSAAGAWRVEAFYYLAQFSEHGIGREKDCSLATQYYKLVAESTETLHSTIPFGNKAYREGRIEDALIANLIAAEAGYEASQVNVAFLLDKHTRAFSTRKLLHDAMEPYVKRVRSAFGLAISKTSGEDDASSSLSDELALRYYTRAASQQNIEALVKAGDYHLYGHGTQSDAQTAVSLWTTAADSRAVPLAYWNLGWSYENGIGVEQDFHLAKRYYDACLETDKSASLPVTLSLLKLRLRSTWNTITGGSINSIKDEEKKEIEITWTSVWTGFKHFWRSQFQGSDLGSGRDGTESNSALFVDEDYPAEFDDLYDTLFILAVCMVVAAIVYVRTAWWPQTRRNHGAGAQPANNGANFDGANLWIGGAAI